MKSAQALYQRIFDACSRVNRDPLEVTLVGVSKKHPPEKIQEYIDFENGRGRRAILGENYVQEWEQKRPRLRGDYSCHLIGHLQSNKSSLATSLFDCIQTVDSIKLIGQLERSSIAIDKKLPVMLQVNISNDEDKFGISKGALGEMVDVIEKSKSLALSGLMTITKIYSNPADAASDFRELRLLGEGLQQRFQRKLYLSMGMSDDFEYAIVEGATHVRVGTALFGSRS